MPDALEKAKTELLFYGLLNLPQRAANIYLCSSLLTQTDFASIRSILLCGRETTQYVTAFELIFDLRTDTPYPTYYVVDEGSRYHVGLQPPPGLASVDIVFANGPVPRDLLSHARKYIFTTERLRTPAFETFDPVSKQAWYLFNVEQIDV